MTELTKILQELKKINERLDTIEKILKDNTKISEKMDEHIDFIDSIYDIVKKPFSRILALSKPLEKQNLIKDI